MMLNQSPLIWPCVAFVLFAGCSNERPARSTGTRPKLVGTEWLVETIDGRPVAKTQDQKPLELMLGEHDRRAAAYGGVNRFGGAYELDGERLRFGPMMSTKMAGPPELNAQEQAFADVLASVRSFKMKGDTLELHAGEGLPARMTLRAAR